MIINTDTNLFGSFSKKAGNVGCMFFNTAFKENNINAIYKSFSVDNIHDAIDASKCLKFSGFAVSMPFKTEIIQYLDEYNDIVKKTNSCNTVIITDSKLMGYNTDYMAVKSYLSDYFSTITLDKKTLYILGNGSYSGTVQVCCDELDIKFKIITRKIWSDIDSIRNSVVFNCTPVEQINLDSSNNYINCINTSETGSVLAKRQSTIQYELYTKATNTSQTS